MLLLELGVIVITIHGSCKFNANFDHMYKLNIDNFQNVKVYKKNKKKNSWVKIDG